MKMKTLAALFAATIASQAAPQPIFDGKTLDGWKAEGPAPWTARDGVLTGTSDEKKKGSILWTEKEYTDFTIELDFRFVGSIDTGVFLRHQTDQIQIGDSGSLKRDMTGSPYISKIGKYPVEAKGVAELLKQGDWNTMRIVAKGNAYSVDLNGKHILDYTSETAKEKGPIGLQVHPNKQMTIEFKNITVEEK